MTWLRQQPPAIAQLKGMGVTGIRISCRAYNCRREGRLAFDALPFPHDLRFPTIQASGRLICRQCGSRLVRVMPDWSGYKPQGGGG
jgi:hypothetical protein